MATVELLGSYGLNSDHEYQDQGKGLRVLKELSGDINYDLLEGYTGDNSHLHAVHQNRDKMGNGVHWMVKNHGLINDPDNIKLFNIDFVCGNGLFKKLFNFPFERDHQKCEFAVTKFKNVIWIKRIEDSERESRQNDAPTYAGCRFEQYVTEQINPADDGKTYYNMMKAEIGGHNGHGGHTLLYSCEVDCIKEINEDKEPVLEDFIELKTYGPIRDKYGSFTEWFKEVPSRRWWAQCAMAGISEIVVGIKDQPRSRPINYIRCKNIERVKVRDIERNAIGWSRKKAFDILIKFLDTVKEIVVKDDPDVVYLFTVETGQEISYEKLTASDHEQYRVVTESMIEKLNELLIQ